MEKQFKHKDGNIKITQEEFSITVDPLEKKEVIKVDSDQSKESLLNEIEDKLNLIYTGSPAIIKEFIKWLEDVV
ncbi:MAG: hypothetical protein H7Y18_13265 [Clostridiaceae bacterium]|nr:hypothetical protein [Clostridiaceae bacterium]